jgi:hypothetical protein
MHTNVECGIKLRFSRQVWPIPRAQFRFALALSKQITAGLKAAFIFLHNHHSQYYLLFRLDKLKPFLPHFCGNSLHLLLYVQFSNHFDPLKKKLTCVISGPRPYRAVNTLYLDLKTSQLRLCNDKVVDCSEIHTKHMDNVITMYNS